MSTASNAGGEWRIRARVCAYDWRRTDRVEGEGGFAETYVRGLRSPDDVRISSVADLADVAPDDLVAASRTVTDSLLQRFDRWGPVAYSSTPFAPVVDGGVLPSAPWAALADGAARDVELLIGHSRDEYSLLAAQLPDIDEAQVDVLIDGLSPTPGAHRYRAAYPSATPMQLRETALSDWLYRMPALHLAAAADLGGARVWLYELCWGFGPHGASQRPRHAAPVRDR